MKKVFYTAIDSYSRTSEISQGAKELLKTVIDEENIKLEKTIPLKVHFGEKGNTTFIEPGNFQGIIDYLKVWG